VQLLQTLSHQRVLVYLEEAKQVCSKVKNKKPVYSHQPSSSQLPRVSKQLQLEASLEAKPQSQVFQHLEPQRLIQSNLPLNQVLKSQKPICLATRDQANLLLKQKQVIYLDKRTQMNSPRLNKNHLFLVKLSQSKRSQAAVLDLAAKTRMPLVKETRNPSQLTLSLSKQKLSTS